MSGFTRRAVSAAVLAVLAAPVLAAPALGQEKKKTKTEHKPAGTQKPGDRGKDKPNSFVNTSKSNTKDH